MIIDEDVYLKHYGKKGMRWGSRKAPTQKEYQDHRIKDRRKQISVKRQHLSDRDIKAYVDRLKTEKQLKDLIDQDIAPGKATAKKILSDSGKTAAKTILTGLAFYLGKKVIEKAVNKVNPNLHIP